MIQPSSRGTNLLLVAYRMMLIGEKVLTRDHAHIYYFVINFRGHSVWIEMNPEPGRHTVDKCVYSSANRSPTNLKNENLTSIFIFNFQENEN